MNVKELQQIEKQIDEFLAYEKDWDYEGALPLSKEVAELAKNLLVEFVDRFGPDPSLEWQEPEVSPLPNGGLDLEWDNPKRKLLLFIRPDCRMEMFLKTELSEIRGDVINQEMAIVLVAWVLG